MAAKRKAPAKSDSILDAKKRALGEQQAKLDAQIAKRQKLIDDAPRIAEEANKKRREAHLMRKNRAEARFGSPVALNDPRYPYDASIPVAPRGLRKHRNQGMYQFFLLCLVLAAVLCWLYFKVIRGT